MAHGSWFTANFPLKKVPSGTTVHRQVWRAKLGMPAIMTGLISKCCRHDREVDSFLFFSAKLEVLSNLNLVLRRNCGAILHILYSWALRKILHPRIVGYAVDISSVSVRVQSNSL